MTHRCPDEETLAAYFDGLLPPPDEATLLADMRTCPDCRDLIATLGLIIDAEDPEAWHTTEVPPAVTARAIALWPPELATHPALSPRAPSHPTTDPITRGLRIAARWLGDALQPLADALTPEPATATLRGAPAHAPREELRYHLTLGDLPLEIEVQVDGPDEIALTIRPLHPPPAGLLMRLTLAGETCAISSLDPEGTTIDALPTGCYELCLEASDHAIGRVQLDLQR